MADTPMTPREQKRCAGLIREIVEEHGCALTIERDEVTVYDDTIKDPHAPHAHHGGENLYSRLVRASATALVYASQRKDVG